MTAWRPTLLAGVSLLLAHVVVSSGLVTSPDVPRTVLALYDSAHSAGTRFTLTHRMAELPLNHLGLVVRYHDIRSGLPSAAALAGVRGVLTWFESDSMLDPAGYLRWAEALVDSGRPLVIIGRLGASSSDAGLTTPLADVNRLLAKLGWRLDRGWLTTTHGSRYRIADPRLFGFERPLPLVAPPYAPVRAVAPDAKVALQIGVDGRASTVADLAIISPRGAWVADGYSHFAESATDEAFRQWYVNPFEFFRQAFGTDVVPKPDTTTIAGRRIYYSHVDGDGWRNLTQVEPYRSDFRISARVLLEQIVRKFPDLPVSVAAIVGDLDQKWHGTAESLAVARELYAEAHVEAAVHTYSHPLEWGAFDAVTAGIQVPASQRDARAARSYHVQPFSLQLEVDEAARYVGTLLPPGKRVGLMQWSGDTRPSEAVVAHTRTQGFANINGGDSRFDPDYPSVSWVAPLGTWAGRELQVYASNSNENTYTDNWRDRFFAFGFLPATVKSTGTPRRLKPFNLYYHAYSAERLASLNALVANLTYARSLALVPIETSRFSRIVDGFFSVRFEPVGSRAWRIRNRGALETVRFDDAAGDAVDFNRSRGVIGQRRELGSLYVALDERDATPVVSLKRVAVSDRAPVEHVPYLIESRWRVFQVSLEPARLRYATEGFGPGVARWHWPHGGRAVARWRAASGRSGQVEVTRDEAGAIEIPLPQLTRERVDVSVEPLGGDRGK